MARARAAAIGPVREIVLAPEGLDTWRGAFRIVQTRQAWESNGDWIARANPRFGPGIADRMVWAATITDDEVAGATAVLAAIRARMDALLADDTVVVMPGASAPPPLCGTAGPVLEDLRARALDILCPAGITGAPQLACPALRTDEGPIGLGFIAARGADVRLLALGAAL
jgi:amidase